MVLAMQYALSDGDERDDAVAEVVAWLLRATSNDPATYFADLTRKAIDEVLDGPRTGRWDFAQLEKTEQTYVGTKIEIMLRAALDLERGDAMDVIVAGHEVDIKWSKSSAWQIPREAVGQICLCIGAVRNISAIKVGVVRCAPAHLNAGKNQDGKKTLSVAGRAAMTMLVENEPLAPNFVAAMDALIRADIMSNRTIQARITALAKAMPYVPIPREAIRTIARTEGDPIRRTRRDRTRPDPLDGMCLLSKKYGNKTVEGLGYPPLGTDEFMAVPQDEVDALESP